MKLDVAGTHWEIDGDTVVILQPFAVTFALSQARFYLTAEEEALSRGMVLLNVVIGEGDAKVVLIRVVTPEQAAVLRVFLEAKGQSITTH